jgi:glycosyltransferase involved in cell wall biosynthesis
MRILYSFPHPIGAAGIGTTAIQQVLGLLNRGHDVTVMATSAHKPAPKLPKLLSTMEFARMRVPHRVLGMDRTMAYHDLCVARHLRRRRNDYDIVHCWPGATLATARVAAKLGAPALREVPNTHTANAYDVVGRLCRELGVELPPGSSHRYNPGRLARETAEYEHAFRLLAPSEAVADSFRARSFPETKLLRHRYGFDPAVFQPAAQRAPGPLRAMFLGAVGPRKGLHVALRAWVHSKASQTGRFAIFGRVEDGYRAVIEPYLGAPGVEMNEFTSDAGGALRASDVLLLPSFEEGSALVTYEAQGCGVIPLVSASAGALCVDGETGFVHGAGDVEALTAHLDVMSEDTGLREQMRSTILARRDTLTWAAAAERLEACYESALSALRAHPPQTQGIDL